MGGESEWEVLVSRFLFCFFYLTWFIADWIDWVGYECESQLGLSCQE